MISEELQRTQIAPGIKSGACLDGLSPGVLAFSIHLKALARASGDRKVEMVEKDEIHRFTGYIRGGVSPLGGKKEYPVFVDQTALDQPIVSVSAGMRGMQLFLASQDLARATQATVVAIGEESQT